MIQQKWELPNGNTLIWFGNQLIHGCEHVLILSGGDVLFLRTQRGEDGVRIRNDISTLTKDAFMRAYGWPNNSSGDDLYWEIRGH